MIPQYDLLFHIPLLGNVLNSLFIFFLFSVLFSNETKDKKETSKMKLSPFYVAQEHAVLSELHRCLERVYEAANALKGQIERNYFFTFYFFLFTFYFFLFFFFSSFFQNVLLAANTFSLT